jgi:hypothetical protein
MNTIGVGARLDEDRLQVLWDDGERALCRGWRDIGHGPARTVLTLRLIAERPARASIDRLAHEYGLRQVLDST